MNANSAVIVRVTPGVRWHALVDDEVAGRAHVLHRPDGRVFISVDTWPREVFAALVDAAAADLRRDLYTMVDQADPEQAARWTSMGFTENRREDEYLIPTAADATGLHQATVPPGFSVLTADAADEDRLRALDDLLRADVPGCDGWHNDPQQFHDYTFDPRHFDPATYLVAVHDGSGHYAGLARVWNDPGHPRLGLIAVAPPYRRRGLARALLAAVFHPLHARGVTQVAAEADTANDASTALLTRIGARRTGGTVELLRRRQRARP